MKLKMTVVILLALCTLLLSAGGTAAQADGPVQPQFVDATVNRRISYQGTLYENGSPVTGNRTLTFNWYRDSACSGTVYQSGDEAVSVSDGLFETKIDMWTGIFWGEAVYLEVVVGGASMGCDEIVPVPYALSLRPGAAIQGAVDGGASVFVENASDVDGSTGIYGWATTTSGLGYGLYGRVSSAWGRAIYGWAEATSGTTYGVYGKNDSTSGRGVYGYSSATSGTTYGVYGKADSNNFSYGVYGVGVYTGVYGEGDTIGVSGSSTNGSGVYGSTSSTNTSNDAGVQGIGSNGVLGQTNAGSFTGYGVQGQLNTVGAGSAAVYGRAQVSSGDVKGVLGESYSTTGGVAVAGVNHGDRYAAWFETGNFPSTQIKNNSGSYATLIITNDGAGPLLEAWNPGDLEFAVDELGNVWADGSFNTPAADFAEMLPAVDGLQPGDVLVVGADGLLARSSQAQQTSVAGVYSTQPGFLGGTLNSTDPAGKIPLAIVGVVPVKASAENGAILPGDLLTSASLPGYAMKASPVSVGGVSFTLPGTILGKAMEALDDGTGTILVLLSLQ